MTTLRNLTIGQDPETLYPPVPNVFDSEKPAGLISNFAMKYIEITLLTVCPVSIAIIGMVGNIVNIVVFLHQGLQDSSTISFFALAISDLASCIFLAISGVCFLIKQLNLSVAVDMLSFQYVFASFQRSMFVEVTMGITMYIAVERCLCVKLPLKVKILFTPIRTVIAMISIYVIVIACYVPIFMTQGLRWVTDKTTNVSTLVMWKSKDRKLAEQFLHSFLRLTLGPASLMVLLVSTFIMIRELRATSKVRHDMTSAENKQLGDGVTPNLSDIPEGKNDNTAPSTPLDSNLTTSSTGISNLKSKQKLKKQNGTLSSRERVLVKTVALVSVIFVVCNIPMVVLVYARLLVPELDVYKRFHNILFTFASTTRNLMGFNSAANVFIFYKQSSRFRRILLHVFFGARGDVNTGGGRGVRGGGGGGCGGMKGRG